MMVAAFELVIEIVLIALVFFVLAWPIDVTSIGIVILPALLSSPVIIYLIMNDHKAGIAA